MSILSHADFVCWRQSRAQVDQHSAQGYLNLLQEIYSDPRAEGPAGIAANQAFNRIRREQISTDDQYIGEIDAFQHEPTYICHKHICSRG